MRHDSGVLPLPLAVLAVIAIVVGPGRSATAETIAITGGRVFPVSGPSIDRATVLIVDGKVAAVGTSVAIPDGATRIDATGKWVTPGFVNAATSLGIVEVDAVEPTNDASATGERGVAAGVRAWDALNPDSELWAPVRQDGFTSVVVLPSGGFVGGQAAFVDTLEAPLAQMVRRAPVGVTLDLTARETAEAGSRGELVFRLRELLDTATMYAAGSATFDGAQLRALWPSRLHVRALVPVVKGTLPLLVSADRAADIEVALSLAREYSLKIVLYGAAEGWKVASDVAAAKVPVVTGGLSNLPLDFDQLGATLENAARLERAGVPLVITAGGANNFLARTARQHAGNAVANGLPWDAALRAVTLTPAEVFGVEASIGSIQPGRDANVVVWDGDPFELATRAEHVFVRGREGTEPSREQLLMERYRTRARSSP
jgi:imidazolonepropionase-like amidohydrolase